MNKRVLFVNTGITWGGVEGWHYKTAVALKKREHEVYVLAVKDSLFFKRCQHEGLNITTIKKITDTTALNPVRQYWLVRYLKRNEIDAVFFCQSSHFKYVSIAARIAGVKKIIYRRALAKPIKNKIYNRLLLKYCVSNFMGISKTTKEASIRDIPDGYLPEGKVDLIYNGVELDSFIEPDLKTDIREEFGISSDDIIIANIGRLSRQKGQTYFIDALPAVIKKHSAVKVLLVGRGSKKEVLQNKLKELGIEDKVIFTGYRDDIPSILKQADFLVHTAIYEGCPWIIIETMAAAKPIVASGIPSVAEIMEDGKTGYLAQDKDPKDIGRKIIKLIETPFVEKVRMGKRAREIVKERFVFANMIDKIEKLYLS